MPSKGGERVRGRVRTTFNPFTEAVDDPKSETLCGGILALTLLPTIAIGWSVWFVRDWVVNSRGTSFISTQVPVDYTTGVRLDATDQDVLAGQGSTLRCTSAAGCWYSVILDEDGQPDRTCPPMALRKHLLDNRDALRQAYEKMRSGAPIARDFRAIWQSNANPSFNKQCMYARLGEVLQGACLYHTPIPTDSLAILFHDEPLERGDSLGVALSTPVLAKVTSGTAASKLFGTEVYEAGVDPQFLHYGNAELNIVSTSSSNDNMRLAGRTIGSVQTLIPSYAGGLPQTADPRPDPNLSPCYQDAGCANLASPKRCVALTLQPGFMLVTQTYVTANIVSAWLASFGGIVSLTMLVLGTSHLLLTRCCGPRCSLCAPNETPAASAPPTTILPLSPATSKAKLPRSPEA